MHDEFEYARERVEAHLTMAAYLASRSDGQLAALIYDETYRRNVFGSYDGTRGEHAAAMIGEVRGRERERCAKLCDKEVHEAKAKGLLVPALGAVWCASAIRKGDQP